MELPVLHAECDQCFGLCCVLLPFSAADGFGTSKPGGTPCTNLDASDRCRIHDRLRESGWSGCVRFDCFGAGQQVSQVTYGGVSWRDQPNLGEMSAVLSVMRQVHELLALLDEAGRRGVAAAEPLTAETLALTGATPEVLLTTDLDELRDRVRPVLGEARDEARSRWPEAPDLARADLAGTDLRYRDLRGADLTGALLIGADLRGVDLTDACLLGADLRDADVRDAVLDGAVFLTGPQRGSVRPG
ncbi:MAG: pentapeptide repeat-containing protein [Nocardioides sp.]|uniref:pentapeptide repeat-containing protein n=1 Tax=Nocardioides sp. TaxID=35761 RepID=UPI003EFE9ABF